MCKVQVTILDDEGTWSKEYVNRGGVRGLAGLCRILEKGQGFDYQAAMGRYYIWDLGLEFDS